MLLEKNLYTKDITNTQTKGATTELLGILAFQSRGYHCSIPFDQSCKYDFIVDINGRLLRIQSKTSTPYQNKEDSIFFSTSRATTNTKRTTRYKYNENEIDYFYTHYNGYDFLVPVSETSMSKILRLTTPSNNNIVNVNVAADYLLDNVLDSIINDTKIKRFIDGYIISIDPKTKEEVEWSEDTLEDKYSIRQINYIRECCNTHKIGYGLIWKQKEFPELI